MTLSSSNSQSDLVLCNGKIITLSGGKDIVEAVAISGDKFLQCGSNQQVLDGAGDHTRVVDLAGATVIPGLIDGHAHMDREGLKRSLPSLAGARSIDDILSAVSDLVARARPGEWIVTMPIGEPPAFDNVPECLAEGRFPNRHDLDSVAPDNPVYIRSIWGYWRKALPLVSIANSAALRVAGIDRNTPSPAPTVEIEKDDNTGEPTGVFIDRNKMPVVELTLMRAAPNFSISDRTSALADSMRLYNAVGTTSVFEGHGVAADVVSAYKQLHLDRRMTVRSTLVFSPAWSSVGDADTRGLIRSWARWLSGSGVGDDWLSVQGIYTEQDDSVETRTRAAANPQTGWAGFHYDSAVPESRIRDVLKEAAATGLQVVGIFPYMLDLYREVDRSTPIGDLRWVFGHLSTMTREQISAAADLGIGVTTHTSAHIYKLGHDHLESVAPERHEEIVPLRSLLDAGVPVAFGSDNVPISLFHSIWHSVARKNREGEKVAPGQALTREEALGCATKGGAWLCFDEDRRGAIAPGRLADATVLTRDPLTCDEDELKEITATTTIVGGQVAFEAGAANEKGVDPIQKGRKP